MSCEESVTRQTLCTRKYPICGIALLLTQWESKEDCADYFADLSQLTLGREVWCKRLYASIVDGEKTMSVTRGMSCAYSQLGHLHNITCGGGWLDDADRVSFAQLAVQLAAFDLLKLEGSGARSMRGSARHGVPARNCIL